MDECYSCNGRQRGTEPCNVTKMKEVNFGDVVDMRYKGEGRFEDGNVTTSHTIKLLLLFFKRSCFKYDL